MFGTGLPQIEIHSYTEGKLHTKIRPRFEKAEKILLFISLKNLIFLHADSTIKNSSLQVLDLISNDIASIPNYSHADDMYADDVLAEVCVMLPKCDFEVFITAINILSEQFNDLVITGGYCPVGRLSRIFQIYSYLKEILK